MNQKLRKLRAIANYAKGLNMHGADPEIFDCVEDKMKWHKFEPRTVSKRVIQLIENVDRSLLTPKEEFCLDLFLFSYYAGGMVNVDVCHLTYNMIQGNQVIYERMKFPKIGKPLLIEKSKQIIEKHEGQGIDKPCHPEFISGALIFLLKILKRVQNDGRLCPAWTAGTLCGQSSTKPAARFTS